MSPPKLTPRIRPSAASPASVKKAAPRRSGSGKPRKRAKTIVNWLGFIRPHLQEYSALPPGEQLKLLQKLSDKTGTNVNTLRRYLGAARFLESVFAITVFPPNRQRMPIASVEAISRIYRKDPNAGRTYMQQLVAGHLTIVELKKQLKNMGRSSRAKSAGSALSEPDIL